MCIFFLLFVCSFAKQWQGVMHCLWCFYLVLWPHIVIFRLSLTQYDLNSNWKARKSACIIIICFIALCLFLFTRRWRISQEYDKTWIPKVSATLPIFFLWIQKKFVEFLILKTLNFCIGNSRKLHRSDVY